MQNPALPIDLRLAPGLPSAGWNGNYRQCSAPVCLPDAFEGLILARIIQWRHSVGDNLQFLFW